jgi:hypothetical protein
MFKEVRSELKKIEAENELLLSILQSSTENGKIDQISVGMKVQITYENGNAEYGRVISLNRNRKQWLINRDGFTSTIGVPENQLKVLYPGIEGIIDKKHWLNKTKIDILKSILRGSSLPEYFRDKEYINVRVVAHSPPSHDYCLIDCEVYGYNPVFTIKIPSTYAINDAYLQLHVIDGDITDIHVISRERYLNLE